MTSSANWFVAAGAKFGDGSREKPFHDLWKAIRNASPGDVIYVAGGTYFGRYDRSSWIIDCPSLTIRGGYSPDFATRNPWKMPSIFTFFPEYEASSENNMIGWSGDPSGLKLDGLLFDSGGANKYDDGPLAGIKSWPAMSGAVASFHADHVTICNCVFINGANGGVVLSGSGSRFENNLLLNLIGTSMLDLPSSPQMIDEPITVRNNSFCFTHDTSDPPGGGADSANGVRVNCPAIVQDNLFVGCGNAGISVFIDPARVSIDRNLFFLSPHDVIRSRAQGNAGEITEKNFDELEDIGFKSCSDNFLHDLSGAGLKPGWVDAYSRHLLINYAKPPRDAANALRAAVGLPILQKGDLDKLEDKGSLAPRFSPADALAVAFSTKQGTHPLDLPGEDLSSEKQVPPSKATLTYRPIDWASFETADSSLFNSRVELTVGLGGEQSVSLLPDVTSETHHAIRIYKPGSDDVSPFVFIPRYTLPARQHSEATRYERGLDVEVTYVVRGVYRTDVSSSRQRVTLVVESIVRSPVSTRNFPVRPQGRDWFVRAGSSGGDGSREKPFRDPFQAMEKAEGGDTIHVASGDYFGKVHAGKWRITIRNLALFGGYNADFTARDPWANSSRFLLHEDEKAKPGRPEGIILRSEENSEGLVLDGFIFDGATWNTYTDGALDLASSPLAPLIDLMGGRAPIRVRNCVFVNGSDGAAKISCPYGEFTNNIIVNTSGPALEIRAGGPGPWNISNNTILFCCDPTDRAGTGESTNDGTILMLSGRAAMNINSNILAFADNFGVRCCVPQPGVSFSGNVLAANLFNHLTDANYLWADSSNWERRVVGDSDFACIQGNTFDLQSLSVDPAFADPVLARLFKLPSRISDDEWKKIASLIGSSVSPEPPAPSAAVPEAAKPDEKSPGHPALDDLMARLSHLDAQIKKADEAAKPSDAAKYCPQYDWKKTMDLALQSAAPAAGAHRCRLTVAFSAGQRPKAAVDYTHVSAEHLDSVRADLNGKSVEIDVSDLRDSSRNPSVYPPGTDRNDYTAYSVTITGESTRTRVAVVVRNDTTASKYLTRTVEADKIRIRGTAYTPPQSSFVSIVVDSAANVEE